MSALDELSLRLPEAAKDLRLNLQAVLGPTSLTPAQRWGVAIASAVTSRHAALRDALVEAARAEVDAGVVDDAFAAAAIMGMNNVLYRFRHVIGKDVYGTKPARLRMNRLARPASTRVDLELFSLAASAINNCEACVRSHEKAVLDGGLSEDQVHDAIRVAATVHAVAVALDMVAPP